jgi:hypothetical protein
MNIHTVHEERLGKLANLLLSEKYRWYEYRLENSSQDKLKTESRTSCIQILDVVVSESINVFPNEWCWNDENENAYYINDILRNPISSALLFYNLDIIMFKHLFMPFNQLPYYFGGEMIGHIVKPSQVGNNIRAFLQNYKSIMN